MHSRLPYLSPLLLTPLGTQASPSTLSPFFGTPRPLQVRVLVESPFDSPSNATIFKGQPGVQSPHMRTSSDSNASDHDITYFVQQDSLLIRPFDQAQEPGPSPNSANWLTMSAQCVGNERNSSSLSSPPVPPIASYRDPSDSPKPRSQASQGSTASTRTDLAVVHRADRPFPHLPSPLQNHIFSPLPLFHALNSLPTPRPKDATFQVRSPARPSPRHHLQKHQSRPEALPKTPNVPSQLLYQASLEPSDPTPRHPLNASPEHDTSIPTDNAVRLSKSSAYEARLTLAAPKPPGRCGLIDQEIPRDTFLAARSNHSATSYPAQESVSRSEPSMGQDVEPSPGGVKAALLDRKYCQSPCLKSHSTVVLLPHPA